MPIAKKRPKKFANKNWDIFRLRGMLATITNIANNNPSANVILQANLATTVVNALMQAVKNAK